MRASPTVSASSRKTASSPNIASVTVARLVLDSRPDSAGGRMTNKVPALACGLVMLALGRPLSVMSDATEAGPLRFRIRFAPEQSREPLDGRLLLLVSNDGSKEPRFQISEGPKTQLVFGIDVEGLKAGEPA